MNRRGFLAGLAAGAAGSAGCLSAPRSGEWRGDRDPPGLDLPVPRSELVWGAPLDGIPAIVDPAFGPDWTERTITAHDPRVGTYEAELSLEPGDRVIGVERDGRARAYPLKVLTYHEVVNDDFGGPLLVTYCPLCGSGVVTERTVFSAPTIFGVSGRLWRGNLVLYDRRTGSKWSQIAATAIRGPATGEVLPLVSATTTSMGEWRAEHPDTDVLLPPPASEAVGDAEAYSYDRDPYSLYATSEGTGVSGNSVEDRRLHPKATVVGVTHGGQARAYPLGVVHEAGVVNDAVGGLPVVVAATRPDGAGSTGAGADGSTDGEAPTENVDPSPVDGPGTLVAYVRRVGGEVLAFDRADNEHLRAGGSRWSIATGEAVDGPHEGTTLRRVNDRSPMFWFAWREFHPGTDVYGQ